MKIEVIEVFGAYRQVADAARTTIRLDAGTKEVSEDYMRKLYLSEHSPIRIRQFMVKVTGIPYWIAMHFTRHKFGIEHWISTQRDDRTGEDREKAPQDALVDWQFMVNSAAVIFISRRRLCSCAHKKTRETWMAILEQIYEVDAPLVKSCVPDCVYRGHCYEYKSCNYHKSESFNRALAAYRKGINR